MTCVALVCEYASDYCDNVHENEHPSPVSFLHMLFQLDTEFIDICLLKGMRHPLMASQIHTPFL
jgi:hypothetical protein